MVSSLPQAFGAPLGFDPGSATPWCWTLHVTAPSLSGGGNLTCPQDCLAD